jgi:hypothetical protein
MFFPSCVHWFTDRRVYERIISLYRDWPSELFVATSQLLVQFVVQNVGRECILDCFVQSALDRLVHPGFGTSKGELNPDQYCALQFVCATISTVRPIDGFLLRDAFVQIETVLCSWELCDRVLSSVVWCWHALLTHSAEIRTSCVTEEMLSVACGLMDREWEATDEFDACPLCPLLHCAAAIFEPPPSELLVDYFPFATLAEFAKSAWEELSLLALSVFEVVTRGCPTLVSLLVEKGLVRALEVAAEGSFEAKSALGRITVNLIAAGAGSVLSSRVMALIFECAPQFDVSLGKQVFSAVVTILEKEATTEQGTGLRFALQALSEEVMAEWEDFADTEVHLLIERFHSTVHP